MSKYHTFIGIDIGKFEVVVSLYGSKSIHTFSNDTHGFKDFFKTYHKVLPSAFVILETTGGYEMEFLKKLIAKNIDVHRAHTRQVKNFIRSLGKVAKSDPLDAQALARYGYERHAILPLFQELSPLSLQLASLAQRRLDLQQMLVQEKNRLQAPNLDPFISQTCKAMIATLQKQIAGVTIEMEKLVSHDSLLTQKMKVLQEIPGIGNVTSLMLIALLPELGHLNRREIASLCGLAPHPQESGTKVGYRRIRGGRKEVRNVLFMAGMTAARSNSKLGVYYKNLINRGKKKMVALVALMRKIIVIANRKLKDLFLSNSLEIKMAA